MDTQKDKNILVVGRVVSTATNNMDEVKQFPASRLSVEDVAELRLTDEELSRIGLKQA